MADDRYNWLDKDTAEQLLRGEQVGAWRGDGAHELEQLLAAAAAVGAKAPEAAPLPGEEAAVAAFRRAARHGARARGGAAGAGVTTVRATGVAERTRIARPFRRGFAVALAACAIGGVAVAAGTGVLPTPFRGGGGDPEPASSVSAAKTPGPLDTREPGAQTDGTTARTPDPTPGGSTTGPGGTPTPGSSPGATQGHGRGTPGGAGGGNNGGGKGGDGKSEHGDKNKLLLSLCRDYEAGKRDQMDRDTLRRLEAKAGGPEKVHAFCRAYLARYQTGGGSGDNDGFAGGLGGDSGGDSAQSGGSGGDQEDGLPSQSPDATPAPSTSTPAPKPSGTATEPGNATPSATPTS